MYDDARRARVFARAAAADSENSSERLRLSQSVSGYFSCEPNYEVPWSIRVHWLSANITISSRDEIRHVVLMQK